MFIRKNRQGYTMVEAAIVLAIVGLIFSAVWIGAAAALESRRQQAATQAIVHISEKMRTLVGQRGVPTGSGNPALTLALCQLGVFPAEMVRSCDPATNTLSIPHGWGNQVTVEPTARTSHYYVRFDGMPRASCVSLAVRVSTRPDETGMIAFSTSAGTLTNTQVTPSSATTLCVEGGYMRFELQLGYDAS